MKLQHIPSTNRTRIIPRHLRPRTLHLNIGILLLNRNTHRGRLRNHPAFPKRSILRITRNPHHVLKAQITGILIRNLHPDVEVMRRPRLQRKLMRKRPLLIHINLHTIRRIIPPPRRTTIRTRPTRALTHPHQHGIIGQPQHITAQRQPLINRPTRRRRPIPLPGIGHLHMKLQHIPSTNRTRIIPRHLRPRTLHLNIAVSGFDLDFRKGITNRLETVDTIAAVEEEITRKRITYIYAIVEVVSGTVLQVYRFRYLILIIDINLAARSAAASPTGRATIVTCSARTCACEEVHRVVGHFGEVSTERQLVVACEVAPADVLDRDVELESVPGSCRYVLGALNFRYLPGYLDAGVLELRVHRGRIRSSGSVRLLREHENGKECEKDRTENAYGKSPPDRYRPQTNASQRPAFFILEEKGDSVNPRFTAYCCFSRETAGLSTFAPVLVQHSAESLALRWRNVMTTTRKDNIFTIVRAYWRPDPFSTPSPAPRRKIQSLVQELPKKEGHAPSHYFRRRRPRPTCPRCMRRGDRPARAELVHDPRRRRAGHDR